MQGRFEQLLRETLAEKAQAIEPPENLWIGIRERLSEPLSWRNKMRNLVCFRAPSRFGIVALVLCGLLLAGGLTIGCLPGVQAWAKDAVGKWLLSYKAVRTESGYKLVETEPIEATKYICVAQSDGTIAMFRAGEQVIDISSDPEVARDQVRCIKELLEDNRGGAYHYDGRKYPWDQVSPDQESAVREAEERMTNFKQGLGQADAYFKPADGSSSTLYDFEDAKSLVGFPVHLPAALPEGYWREKKFTVYRVDEDTQFITFDYHCHNARHDSLLVWLEDDGDEYFGWPALSLPAFVTQDLTLMVTNEKALLKAGDSPKRVWMGWWRTAYWAEFPVLSIDDEAQRSIITGHSLSWEADGVVYRLKDPHGRLSCNEMIKIAKSVK